MTAAVAVKIKTSDGFFLLLDRNHSPFGWGLPGGKIEEKEAARDAAVREVKEETGIDISMCCFDEIRREESANGREVFVFFTTLEWPVTVTLSNEHKGFAWVKETDDLILAGRTGMFLKETDNEPRHTS